MGAAATYTILQHWTSRRTRFLDGYLWVLAETYKREVRHGERPSFTAVCIARKGAFSLVPVSDGKIQHREANGALSPQMPLHVYRQLVIDTFSDRSMSSNLAMD